MVVCYFKMKVCLLKRWKNVFEYSFDVMGINIKYDVCYKLFFI